MSSERQINAYIGDALILIFARELACAECKDMRIINPMVVNLTNNNQLAKVAQSMGMVGGKKSLATQFEEKVYEIYKKKGLDEALSFYKAKVYHRYIQKTKK